MFCFSLDSYTSCLSSTLSSSRELEQAFAHYLYVRSHREGLDKALRDERFRRVPFNDLKWRDFEDIYGDSEILDRKKAKVDERLRSYKKDFEKKYKKLFPRNYNLLPYRKTLFVLQAMQALEEEAFAALFELLPRISYDDIKKTEGEFIYRGTLARRVDFRVIAENNVEVRSLSPFGKDNYGPLGTLSENKVSFSIHPYAISFARTGVPSDPVKNRSRFDAIVIQVPMSEELKKKFRQDMEDSGAVTLPIDALLDVPNIRVFIPVPR